MSEINNLRRQLNILLDATNKRPELVKRLQREILALMNAKAESKEDLELAEVKKRAEVVSDEAWNELRSSMANYLDGRVGRDHLTIDWMDFELAHNTERGLRHEKV